MTNQGTTDEKKLKILYLCPKNPYPLECGEDFGYDKDISELAKSKYKDNLKLIIGNRDKKNGKFLYEDLNYKIFPSKEGNLSTLMKNIICTYNLIFTKFIRTITKFITKEMLTEINSDNADIVILDSIYGMAMLPKNDNYKLIYIAHNNEAELAFDMAKMEKKVFKKLYFYLQALKIKKLEKELIKKASILVCVSTSDYKYFSHLYPEKSVFFPHKADTGHFSWKPNKTKTLLFCGPIVHNPNLEAINWIANSLAPILDIDIRIKIAGKGTDELPAELNKPNIDYLGFISLEDLQSLYQTCSAFICPIIYGSGVKIKVTEALSYGMPIIATKESLEGLDYINIEPLIDRDNIQETKNNIESLLNDNNKLKQYSADLISKMKEYQQKTDNSLEKIIDKCLEEK